MINFWNQIKKPFVVLAPMADVTDAAFRHLIAKYGKPDVIWTEFVSVDGLCSPGRNKLLIDLKYSSIEKPIVAQLFSGKPDKFKEAATLAAELGFDGVDINMGCPDKTIEKQGAGAALIKNPNQAKEIIRAAKEGGLPVSVKTRIGYNKVEIEEWLNPILEEEPAAITVHLRTRKEMSKVPARWELMHEVREIVRKTNTLLIGNGDVKNPSEAHEKIKEYQIDGIMIGRGIFGNPWLFSKSTLKENLTLPEILKVLVEHANLFESHFRGIKNFAIMKKHFKAYVSSFDGAKDLRMSLMETNSAPEVQTIVERFIHDHL